MKKYSKRLVTCFLSAGLSAAAVQATTLARMSLDELARAADAVARVTCLAGVSRWEDGQIWTMTHFEVTEPLAGSLPRYVSVRLPGGHIGNLNATVEGVPRFAPGEDAILFLVRTRAGDFSVVSWVQGTFRIRRDPRTGREAVTQDTSVVAVFDPAARKFREDGLRRMPLEVFRQRLAGALARRLDGRQP